MYKCTLNDGFGKEDVLLYDNKRNVFFEDGKKLKVKVKDSNKPRNRRAYHIRVVLGRGCNLQCKYCRQRDSKTENLHSMDIETFYSNLKRFVGNKKIKQVDFWGGEPLLYFDKIQYLHERLSKEMGVKNFYFSTNGTLLNNVITDFLIRNKVYVSVSYDGDGQLLRGYDLEHDEKVVDCLRRLNDAGLVLFTPVMTKFNWDIYSYKEKVANLLKSDLFKIFFVPMAIVDEEGYEYRIPEERLMAMSNNLYENLIEGKLNEASNTFAKVFSFIKSLGGQVNYPSCLSAQENYLPLDLEGNILSCHNYNKDAVNQSNEKLYLGNISEIQLGKKLKIPIKEWLSRWNTRCSNCLVKYMCRGGCSFQTQEYEEYNCKMKFYYYLAFFGLAVSTMTGKSIKKIELV
jgi:uncharacterized protein